MLRNWDPVIKLSVLELESCQPAELPNPALHLSSITMRHRIRVHAHLIGEKDLWHGAQICNKKYLCTATQRDVICAVVTGYTNWYPTNLSKLSHQHSDGWKVKKAWRNLSWHVMMAHEHTVRRHVRPRFTLSLKLFRIEIQASRPAISKRINGIPSSKFWELTSVDIMADNRSIEPANVGRRSNVALVGFADCRTRSLLTGR